MKIVKQEDGSKTLKMNNGVECELFTSDIQDADTEIEKIRRYGVG